MLSPEGDKLSLGKGYSSRDASPQHQVTHEGTTLALGAPYAPSR